MNSKLIWFDQFTNIALKASSSPLPPIDAIVIATTHQPTVTTISYCWPNSNASHYHHQLPSTSLPKAIVVCLHRPPTPSSPSTIAYDIANHCNLALHWTHFTINQTKKVNSSIYYTINKINLKYFKYRILFYSKFMFQQIKWPLKEILASTPPHSWRKPLSLKACW